MLIPSADIKEFKKIGFRRCKHGAGRAGYYYLCISRGRKVIFVSSFLFDIQDWEDDDPRIHVRPNCRYRDRRDVFDFLYQLIKSGMLKGDWEE